jgi:hypothetical protein
MKSRCRPAAQRALCGRNGVIPRPVRSGRTRREVAADDHGEARFDVRLAEPGQVFGPGMTVGISSHMTSLKESGLITGRPQGRSVYYRLARPELDSVLEAAETLLAAAGQRVRLNRHDSQPGGTTRV